MDNNVCVRQILQNKAFKRIRKAVSLPSLKGVWLFALFFCASTTYLPQAGAQHHKKDAATIQFR